MLAELRGAPKPKPEVVLAELDAVLRDRPTPNAIFNHSADAIAWIGRAAAVLGHWDTARGGVLLMAAELDLHTANMAQVNRGHSRLIALLSEARHSIRMATAGPLNVAVGQGMTFDYFNELRKITERAAADLLFVDPYLDADFVERYLVHVAPGVGIRLLTRFKLQTLLPAVDAFAKQSGISVAVRTADNLHDRFVFVDAKECFQSGASFKDGAVKADTTVTQITDAFDPMHQAYEALWAKAKVER
jgi:hypothetical protein